MDITEGGNDCERWIVITHVYRRACWSSLYLVSADQPSDCYHSENLQKNPLRHLYYELEMSPRIFAKSLSMSPWFWQAAVRTRLNG